MLYVTKHQGQIKTAMRYHFTLIRMALKRNEILTHALKTC